MQFSSRRHLPDQELSREKTVLVPRRSISARDASDPARLAVTLTSTVIPKLSEGKTGPSAVQRYRLAWIAHHRDTHEAAVCRRSRLPDRKSTQPGPGR